MSFSFRLNIKEYLKIILLQLIILILLFQPINNYLDIFILFCFKIFAGKIVYVVTLTTLILLYAPIGIVHELLHALAYKIIGGKPKIGFKGIYAYTMETSDRELSRTEFLVILLMPVVSISVICMIIPWDIFRIAFYLNLLGSCGDLYISVWLCKLNKNVKISDRSDGFDVISGFDEFNL